MKGVMMAAALAATLAGCAGMQAPEVSGDTGWNYRWLRVPPRTPVALQFFLAGSCANDRVQLDSFDTEEVVPDPEDNGRPLPVRQRMVYVRLERDAGRCVGERRNRLLKMLVFQPERDNMLHVRVTYPTALQLKTEARRENPASDIAPDAAEETAVPAVPAE